MPATLERLFSSQSIQFRQNQNSIKEALSRYKGDFVLVDSNHLHEYNALFISIRKDLPHRSFYPGRILTLGESSFRFELSEEQNKPELDVPYKTVWGFLYLVKEDDEFVASYYYRNPDKIKPKNNNLRNLKF
jgi:hypothetical protein